MLTGEPRSATLLARVPAAVSELSRAAFLAVAAGHPVLLANLARIASRRCRTAAVSGSGRRAGAPAEMGTAPAAAVSESPAADGERCSMLGQPHPPLRGSAGVRTLGLGALAGQGHRPSIHRS